jgi:hypothetical protein
VILDMGLLLKCYETRGIVYIFICVCVYVYIYIYTIRVCNQFKSIKDNYYLQACQASVFISLLFSEL